MKFLPQVATIACPFPSTTARRMMEVLGCLLALLAVVAEDGTAEDGLVAHWKLTANERDNSSHELRTINHGVRFEAGAAVFDGRTNWLEVPDPARLNLGKDEFTIAVWIHTEEQLDDVLGDVVTWYDPARRNGFTLTLMNYAGVTSAQSNWRNVLFGIDADRTDARWTDCGRPGQNRYVKSLVVFDGSLYAATWEPGEGQRGHIYRYAGGQQWIDCGSPDPANAICGVAVYQGRLYAGSELYSGGGSALPLSVNTNHGGRVYRYEGGKQWTDVGKIADVRSVSGLAVFQGKLYAGTGTTGAWRDTPRIRGMYRYDGDGKWTSCGCPGSRIVHLVVHDGQLYGLSYDGGGFFRYEGGEQWSQRGPVPDTTQVYSTAIYEGRMHVGTWPTGSVFRYDGSKQWSHMGRLGEEKEVMGMAVYNGQLYAGTLPMADVYRYEGDRRWSSTGQLDRTPNAKYRRAWSMAVFDGKLFCGVLPSGHVLSLESGTSVTYDRAIPPGWRHLVAVKADSQLRLYLDGKLVNESDSFDSTRYELAPETPLKIGFGQHDYFNGKMRDVRIYNRALSGMEVKQLTDSTFVTN